MSKTVRFGEIVGEHIGSFVMIVIMTLVFMWIGWEAKFASGLAVIVVYLWDIKRVVDRQTELLSADYTSDDERA